MTPISEAGNGRYDHGGATTAEERAAKWETFALLRTVISQSSSSLVTEAFIKLQQLEDRVRDAEALGDV